MAKNNLPALPTSADMQRDIDGKVIFSTFVGNDLATTKKLYNAMSSAASFEDNLGKTMHLTDFVLEPARLVNDEATKIAEAEAAAKGMPRPEAVLRDAVRIVLVCEEGNFANASVGVLNSVKRICNLFGHPASWEEPLPVIFKQEKTRKGQRVFTLEIAD